MVKGKQCCQEGMHHSLTLQATTALERYHVHAVVANILHTRKDVVSHQGEPGRGQEGLVHSCAACALVVLQHWRLLWLKTTAAAVYVLIAFSVLQVYIVRPAAPGAASAPSDGKLPVQVETVQRPGEVTRIEQLLVPRVVALHTGFQAGTS